jgi:hypothetical protein
MELELKRGEVYRFWHKRAGEFVAQVLGMVEGDEADPEFIHVRIDVREGSGQERLALSTAGTRERNLRPSLILRIEKLEGEHWLRQLKLVKPPSLADRLFARIAGKEK